MPFIPTPNGAQVEVRYTQDQQRVENTFWVFTPSATPTNPELQDIANIFWSNWTTYFQPWQSSTLTIREIYVTDQSDAAGGQFTFNSGLPTTGINVNEPMPNSTTLAVSLRTASRGRSYRGRSYVLGLTRNVVQSNIVTAPAIAVILAGYDALINALALDGYQLAICSKFHLGAPRTQGILTPVVDALISDSTIDSQRRRLPGRGA